jgi:hypothetical protein
MKVFTNLPRVSNLHRLIILAPIRFVQVALVLYCRALCISANVFHVTCFSIYSEILN